MADALLAGVNGQGASAPEAHRAVGAAYTLSEYSIDAQSPPFAEGAMGSILMARDEVLGRTVALKAMRREHLARADLRARFRREAAITARLQHPGVPPVFGVGTIEDARPFFSMRLVEGTTLAEQLKASVDRCADRPRFLTIFGQVCQTIAFAHDQGVIHRDLKPENIIVGDFGTVYVIDWGIAGLIDAAHPLPGREPAGDRPLAAELTTAERPPAQEPGAGADGADADCSLTAVGDLLGTPQYMAPEQARGGVHQDERADVFSLGALLFEILTGEPLRPVATVRAGWLNAFSVEYACTVAPRLSAARADAPVAALAARCLEPDRERRPRDAREVAAEMTAYLLHVLRRPEREMARFFELSPDLFGLASLDGYFRRVNENFARVLGYQGDEILSRPYLDFVHPDDVEQTRRQMVKLTEGKPVVRFENRYRDHRGEYRWFEWNAQAVPDEDMVFAVARDITGRRNLERRLLGTVESSPMGVVIVDRSGRIVQVNREAERLFGYDREELIGRPVEMLVPARFRGEHEGRREAFLASRESRPGRGREVTGLRKDGREVPLELGLSPFDTEEGTFVTAVLCEAGPRGTRAGWLLALLRSHPEAVLLVDEHARIGLANERAERLFGYGSGELAGRPIADLVDGFRPDAPAALLEGRARDGARFVVEVRPVPTPGGAAAVAVRLVAAAVDDPAALGRGEESP
ncbi:PAS domain S-box protein [Aquisphaera giovannonii]|uniref:PAS domain S-box protein n=1 Tax=Aquisphaera giovannonii TaxID=406548 RepID=UPI001AEFBC36|nr:PAS domain S-box protein [Aquisphaera giovannonii]